MGSKGSTTVQSPDPFTVAQADATFNRINQFTPFGNLTFSNDGQGINNVATMSLNPQLAGLFNQGLINDQLMSDVAFDRLKGLEGGLPDVIDGLNTTVPGLSGFSGPITGANGIPSIGGDFEGARSGVEQAVFDRSASLLNPQFQQSEERLLQSLADRGIPRDSEAGRTELANFQQQRDLTFSNLANDAVLAGGQEQSRLFGLDERAGLFGLGAENQAFNQGNTATSLNNQVSQQNFGNDIALQLQNANLAQANRATQFNELASLLGLQQTAQPGLNNFFGPGQVDTAAGFGLQQNANIANANSAASAKGGTLGGILGS